jgi:uncharacterized membrane protein YraQ (UPF0718 family)
MFNAISQYLVYDLFGLARGSKLGSALDFFLYDTAKILILLVVIIFAISFARSFFPPEKTRKMLARKGEFAGNILAALLGVATPFCSCSAVPLFIGFVEGGVPLGVTFSFLISSPMVNEVAVVLLWGLFGWKITAIYIGTGLCVAIIGGFIIGRLKLEKWVQEYVYQMHLGETDIVYSQTFRERVEYAKMTTKDILGRIWPWVVGAIAVGAFIHGYVPEDFLVRYAGAGKWYAVPLAILIGVPLYSNAAGVIPIIYTLMSKGITLGTALAFMMSVTALSLPEMIILRQVLKVRLLAVFVGIMAVTIMAVGFLFNAIM